MSENVKLSDTMKRILLALDEKEPRTAAQVAEVTRLPRSSVSARLADLGGLGLATKAGTVSGGRAGAKAQTWLRVGR